MTLENKRLLIMGGSRISKQIVNQAKAMGVYTIVTDWYDLEASPAKQVADKWYKTSTTDYDAMLELIEKEQIDGVLTGFTDSTLPHYAKVCELAGLPCYGSEELFELFTNKENYKKKLEEFDIPTINQYDYTWEEIKSGDIDVKYPLLVKPSDGSGGKGISICQNYEELVAGYETARNVSETESVLIERFVKGEECTLFFLFEKGEVYLTGIGNRHTKKNQGKDTIPLVVGYTFPSYLIPDYVKRTLPKMKAMFKSVGIKDGMMFAQCLIEDGEVIIYDIGYRLTGSLEYILQDAICGYNPLKSLIRFALTGEMFDADFDRNLLQPVWPEYAYNVSLLVETEKEIAEIHGIEEIKQYPGVIDAVQARVVGDKLPPQAKGTLQQISCRVFGHAQTEAELQKAMTAIYDLFEIKDPSGASIKLKGLEPEDLVGKLEKIND